MNKARRLEDLLEIMQDIDKNGDWKGAPLTAEVIECMFETLLAWYEDTGHIELSDAAEVLTDMWDEVYAKLWEEEVISEVEWEIFLHQAGDVKYWSRATKDYVLLGSKLVEVHIVRDVQEYKVKQAAVEHVLETAKVLMELSELMYEDDNLNELIAGMNAFSRSVDDIAADLWELSEKMRSN